MADLNHRVDVVEVLYRNDPELARAVIERHRRIIRRLRDRLSQFIPPEELRAILSDEDIELGGDVYGLHSEWPSSDPGAATPPTSFPAPNPRAGRPPRPG